MKKMILPLLLIIFIFAGCEENFSPKGEFREFYALNSVLRADTNYQAVVISKSYDVNGYDPFTNTSDPSVHNAYVRVWYKDTVYLFRDTTTLRVDTTRYDTPVYYYYSDIFQPEKGENVEIEALLSNGKRLTSTTTIPRKITIKTTETTIPPEDNAETFYVAWEPTERDLYYIPKLTLMYYNENSANPGQLLSKEIPQQIVDVDGKRIKLFPIASRKSNYVFDVGALTETLKSISYGDTIKSGYKILIAKLEIIAFDKYLSSYYSSSNRDAGNLSVTVDNSDYTNVDGGFGLFGSFIKESTNLRFDDDYILKLGYRPAF